MLDWATRVTRRSPEWSVWSSSIMPQLQTLNPSYGAEPKKSGLSPVFGESLDYISTPACVTREDTHVGTPTVACPYPGVIVNPPQAPGQSQSQSGK